MADYSTWFDRVWSSHKQQWVHECRFCRGRVNSPDDFEAHMRDITLHSQSQRQGVFEVLTNSMWKAPSSSLVYKKIAEYPGQAPAEWREWVQQKLPYIECPQEKTALYAKIGQAFLEGKHVGRELAPLLFTAETSKPLHLLELAVWKHACMATLPQSPPLTSLTAVLAWQTQGWKKNKTSHFRCNDIMIIMDRVVPFLVKTEDDPFTTPTTSASGEAPSSPSFAARPTAATPGPVPLLPVNSRRLRSRSETADGGDAAFRRAPPLE